MDDIAWVTIRAVAGRWARRPRRPLAPVRRRDRAAHRPRAGSLLPALRARAHGRRLPGCTRQAGRHDGRVDLSRAAAVVGAADRDLPHRRGSVSTSRPRSCRRRPSRATGSRSCRRSPPTSAHTCCPSCRRRRPARARWAWCCCSRTSRPPTRPAPRSTPTRSSISAGCWVRCPTPCVPATTPWARCVEAVPTDRLGPLVAYLSRAADRRLVLWPMVAGLAGRPLPEVEAT